MRAFLLRSIKYNRQSVHLIDTLGGAYASSGNKR